MKKNLVIYLLAVLQITSLFAQDTSFPFYEGTFAALEAKAKAENKSFFVSFVTASCEPCDNMEQQTFSDPAFIEYTQNHYLAYEVRIDGFRSDDLALAQQYRIMFYPTTLIFNPEGRLMNKFTGFKQADVFISDLQQYESKSGVEEKDIVYTEIDLLAAKQSNFPPPINVASASFTQAVVKREEKPVPIQRVVAKRPTAALAKGKGLFRISVSEQASEGYGLQLGVYKEYGNVIKEVQRLEAAGHKQVLVNIGSFMGKAVFKLAIGPFSSKEAADDYRRNMKTKEDRSGFIVELAKYNK